MSARTIVVQQPNYVPWIGYFDLMHRADVWVWLDDVQYTKNDWRNRNRIAGRGPGRWITVPVRSRGRFGQSIRETEIDHATDWAAAHLAAYDARYRHAPFHGLVRPLLERHLAARPTLLVDLIVPLAEETAALLGIAPRFVRASSLEGVVGTKADRVLAICDRFDCPTYLSGPRGRDYIDAAQFASRGYDLRFARYDYPPYDRGGTPSGEPLSILDPLSWIGPAATMSLIRAASAIEPW
jgi:WbqC-like protein family